MSNASLLFFGLGVLLAAVALPLILGKVPMNRWYGVRVPRAFESPEKWYAINRVGGLWLLADAGVLILGGALMFHSRRLDPPMILVPVAVVIASLVGMLVHVSRLD